MGGKIPRQIKEKVIREWLQGKRREIMQRTMTSELVLLGILLETGVNRKSILYMELFPHLAVKLKENGLGIVALGFAIRLLKIMEDNGINVNQIELVVCDFATYSFKHQISSDTHIQSGYEALSLEKELAVPIKILPEHIARAKNTRDDLLNQSQKQLGMLQDTQSEYVTIKSKVEEYKVKYPLVARNIELEKELDETRE